MPWGKPKPKPRAYVNEHPGPAPWVPVPSGAVNQPYTVWLTGLKDFSLARVSQQVYGIPSMWPKIALANPRIDPFAVPAGVHLMIPHHDAGEKPQQRLRGHRRRITRW
jgi:hypothetical protein